MYLYVYKQHTHMHIQTTYAYTYCAEHTSITASAMLTSKSIFAPAITNIELLSPDETLAHVCNTNATHNSAAPAVKVSALQ